MTMPHLMNCDHSDSGWCLDCVKHLWEEKYQAVIDEGKFSYALQATAQRLDDIRHDAHVKAIGLLEVPARVGMLVNEVKQLRDTVKRLSKDKR